MISVRTFAISWIAVALGLVALAGCGSDERTGKDPAAAPKERVLRSYPADSMEGVISRDVVRFDPDVSSDGNGSLRVESRLKTSIRLWALGSVGMDAALLTYRAKLRSRDLDGKAYLEMLVNFGDRKEFFARTIDVAVQGDTDWTLQVAPFKLPPGYKPEMVRLNLVIDGKGTVWIDDASLSGTPRQ